MNLQFHLIHRVFFYLLLVLLPTQLGVHYWPEWSHVLGRRVDYLSPTLFLTDIMIIIMIVSWMLESVRAKKVSFIRIYPGILFFVFICMNMIFATNLPVAVISWIKILEIVFVVWYIVRSKPSITTIYLLLAISIVYSSLIAISQFYLQHSIGGMLWMLGERTFDVNSAGIARVVLNGREILRVYGTFPHPNVLGGFLAVSLTLITAQLIYKDVKTKRKALYITAVALGSIALILTFSRSAWVGALLGLGVVFWNHKKSTFVIAACTLIVFAGIYWMTPLSISDESVVIRRELNIAAVTLWQTSPLIGIGLGNFLVELPSALVSRQIYFLQPAHNIYLLLLSETGLIGILFAVLGAIVLFRSLSRKHGIHPVYGAFFVFLLLGLVDHYPLTLQQGRLFFALLVALCLSV